MIYHEFVVSCGNNNDKAEEAYWFCWEHFGGQNQQGRMIWECKSFNLKEARFLIYREEDATLFSLKYG